MKMEIVSITLQIALIALGFFAYFSIKNLIPSYFDEKGKNLATKEDIGEITEIVKKVETEIKVKENAEIDYLMLKRKTILEYFSALVYWQNIIINSHADTSDDNILKNKILIEKINEIEAKYHLKQGEVEIFISDNSFYKLRTSLVVEIIKCKIEFEKHCLEISRIIAKEKDLNVKGMKILEENEKYHAINLNKLKEIMPIRNKLIEYLSNVIMESFKSK
jgi:chromosome segregation ATPase